MVSSVLPVRHDTLCGDSYSVCTTSPFHYTELVMSFKPWRSALETCLAVSLFSPPVEEKRSQLRDCFSVRKGGPHNTMASVFGTGFRPQKQLPLQRRSLPFLPEPRSFIPSFSVPCRRPHTLVRPMLMADLCSPTLSRRPNRFQTFLKGSSSLRLLLQSFTDALPKKSVLEI